MFSPPSGLERIRLHLDFDNYSQYVSHILNAVYNLNEMISVERTTTPQWHTTFRVTGSDRNYYLKCYRPGYSPEGVSFSHALNRHCHVQGFGPTLTYLPTLQDKTFFATTGFLCDLSLEIPGEKYPMYKLEGSQPVLAETARRLAELHQVARSFPARGPKAWPHAMHVDDATSARLTSTDLRWSLLGSQSRRARDVLYASLAYLAERSEKLGLAGARAATGFAVHGDFTLNNLIFRQGRLVGTLDWESANGPELPLYDILKSAASFFPGPSLEERLADEFIGEYCNVNPGITAGLCALRPMWIFLRTKWCLKMLSSMSASEAPRCWRSIEVLAGELRRMASQ